MYIINCPTVGTVLPPGEAFTVILVLDFAVISPIKIGAVVATPAVKVAAYAISPIFRIEPTDVAKTIIVAVFGPLTPVHTPTPLAERCFQFTVPAFVLR